MGKRIYHVLDGDSEDEITADLRPKGLLGHPLTRKVKAAATLIGALVAISGYVLGAGKYAIKWGGIATVAELDARAKTAEEHRQGDNKVDQDRADALSKKLDALNAKIDALAVELGGRQRRKRPISSPVQASEANQ